MQVHVLFFGVLSDVVGRRSETLTVPKNATLRHVLAHYEREFPQLNKVLSSVAVALNQEYSHASAGLSENDEVALLPPVSGGSAPAERHQAKPSARVAIVREKIHTTQIADWLKHPADGACVVFEGIVRDNSSGRRTLYLDYESYEEMALAQMRNLLSQALEKFPVRDAAIVHRLGRLAIGETSVLIVVAAAHRGSAFEACRWLIDSLKKTVPIWKKEHFEDGAVWADGEPFPAEVIKPVT